MGSKKVLFCASTASHILNFHMPYIEYFRSIGYEVDTVTKGNIRSDFISNSYDFEFNKRIFSLKNIKSIFKLAGIIKRENYTLISSHATLAGVMTRAALLLSGRKAPIMLHTVHGYLFQDNFSIKAKIYLFIEKILAQRTDLLVTMNSEDYRIASKYRLCKNVEYVHGCGIISAKLPVLNSEDILRTKSKYGINPNDKVLLYVGEFSKRKNQAMLIEAFAEAVKKLPQIKLLFAGEGRLKSKCIRLAESLNVSENVVFCGYVSEVIWMYRISDIVISTSQSEGLPFNIMEALHCGVPVIATKVKGHTDLVKENFNGNLVNLNDISALTECIIKLAADEEFYTKIKKNVYLCKEYYIENTFSEMKKIYYQALESGR